MESHTNPGERQIRKFYGREVDTPWVSGVRPRTCSWGGTELGSGPNPPGSKAAFLPFYSSASPRHQGSSESFCAISCPFPTSGIVWAKTIKGKHAELLTEEKVENGVILPKPRCWFECHRHLDAVCPRKLSSRNLSRWWLYTAVSNNVETGRDSRDHLD